MNWKSEAIDHLNRYEAMVQATQNIPQELTRLEEAAEGFRSTCAENTKVRTSGSSGEDFLISNLMLRQSLTRSYRNARIWVDTTDKALSVLQPEEKQILFKMYIHPEKGSVSQLCEDLAVEQSTVYRKRDTALSRFTLALYGAS